MKEQPLSAELLTRLYESSEACNFPTEILPDSLGVFAKEHAKALYVPIDYVAGPLLVALGGAIGRARILEIKKGYRVSTALWLIVIGSSGKTNSPACNKAIAPLADLEGNESVDGGKLTLDDKIIVSDITMEALAEAMKHHPRGLAMVMDEMASWVSRFNRYRIGGGSDEQDYMSIWSGEPLKIDRKTSDSVHVPAPFLAITGTIPPDPLRHLLTPRSIQSGMEPRFLLCWPNEMKRKWTEDEVDPHTETQVTALFRDLRALKGIDEVVTFSQQSKQLWRELASSHSDEMNGELPEALQPVWSKLESYAGRLILILHLVENISGPDQDDVRASSVRGGWKLVGYFKAQAWKAYRILGLRDGPQTGSTPEQRLQAWIERDKRRERVAPRDVVAGRIPGIGDVATARAVLDQLAAEGFGRWSGDAKYFLPHCHSAGQHSADPDGAE